MEQPTPRELQRMGVRRIWSERDLPNLTTETWWDLQVRDCRQTCDQICPCSEAFDRGPGDGRSVEDWDELLLSEIERQQAEVAFRADVAFTNREI
jgi:hypothetical protein